MNRTLLVVAILGLLTPGAAWAKKKGKGKQQQQERQLTMDKGTKELGGFATIDFASYGGETDVALTLAPAGGYFVNDQVEVIGSVAAVYVNDNLGWAVNGGLRYFFDMKPSWAYVGALAGYADTETLSAYGLGGLIYPLGRNVGLDLGVQLGIQKMSGIDDLFITGSLGYLGVHGYFK